MKKKSSVMLCCVLCLCMLIGCAVNKTPSNSDNPESSKTPSTSQSASVAPSETTAPVIKQEPAPALESSGPLGNYSAEIKESVLTKDYKGKPAIVITYSFTNNGEDAKSAMVALNGIAYQNGVQLESAVIADSTFKNIENSMKDVKTGGTLDIQASYLLSSETAPVEFELKEFISFSDDMLGKTFEIAPGGTTELATIDVPADAVSGSVNGFEVSIISCAEAKDYQGADAVVVTFGFKNNSNKTANFMTALSYSAYQDNVELSHATVTGVGLADALMKNVKPGAAILATAAYNVTSASPIEIEVEPLFSLSSTDKVTRTFTIE
jgi:hypothetical protein